jgi:hypothetical protein
MSSRSHRVTTSGPSGVGTIVVVDTTTAYLIISLSLALLQLLRCWTSNWARVAFACEYTRNQKKEQMSDQEARTDHPQCNSRKKKKKKQQISRWMRLKMLLVTRINWSDKYLYMAR